MALLTAKGNILPPEDGDGLTTTGNVVVTGLGFQPKLIMFLRAGGPSHTDAEFMQGATDGTGQWVVSHRSDDALVSGDPYRYMSFSSCIAVLGTGVDSGSLGLEASIASLDSDGFTMNFTTATLPAGTRWVAFGGDSLEVSVGGVPISGVSGADSILTGLSFQPKALQVSTWWRSLSGTPEALQFTTMGFATGASEQFSIQAGERVGSPSETFRYASKVKILKRSLNIGVAPDVEVEFKQFNTDGFKLNINPAPGAQDLPYIAWGGNIEVASKIIEQPVTAGTQSISGLGFTPSFSFIYSSVMPPTSTDSLVSNGDSAISFGFSDGTNSLALEARGKDGETTTDSYSSKFDGVYSAGASKDTRNGQATYSNTVDGFDLEWTDNDGNPRELFGLVIGDAGGEESESDSWAFAATANITFGGIKHSSDNLALAQTAQLSWVASKSASDALNIDVNASVSADGTKQTLDNIQLPVTAALAINGTKHTEANIQVAATGDISLNGIKHSSGTMQITAYAVVDWVGSSEVTRTGSITIQAVAGITFGGIKHTSDSIALAQTANASANGTKTTADGWAINQAASAELNGLKATGDDWAWQAAASVSMAGFSSQAATHSMSIQIEGVLQSLHLVGTVSTTNIKGYI